MGKGSFFGVRMSIIFLLASRADICVFVGGAAGFAGLEVECRVDSVGGGGGGPSVCESGGVSSGGGGGGSCGGGGSTTASGGGGGGATSADMVTKRGGFLWGVKYVCRTRICGESFAWGVTREILNYWKSIPK